MNLDQQRLCIELKRLDWAHQLKEEVIQDIAPSAKLMEFQAGQVFIEFDSEINHVYFVVTGRLEGALFDRVGKEFLRDAFQRSGALKPDQGKLLQQGVERIIHHLPGVQIGLALGGGAARGMAHLGVL
jgi:hypothetical protein